MLERADGWSPEMPTHPCPITEACLRQASSGKGEPDDATIGKPPTATVQLSYQNIVIYHIKIRTSNMTHSRADPEILDC